MDHYKSYDGGGEGGGGFGGGNTKRKFFQGKIAREKFTYSEQPRSKFLHRGVEKIFLPSKEKKFMHGRTKKIGRVLPGQKCNFNGDHWCDGHHANWVLQVSQ